MSDGGKGSAQRPFDHQKFSENFEKIFGKKTEYAGKKINELVDEEVMKMARDQDKFKKESK
jgi:uncharacterized protein with von Willebrand factor type A (vWA) domain